MFTRTGRRTVLPLLAAIALLAASCGGESTDDAASTDEIVTDEAATDGDPTDGESTDGESTDGDTDDGATDPAADGDAGADDGETAEAAGTTSGTGLDTSLFLDGALAGEPTVEPCTLSDGSTSECYTVTVVGTPIDQAVGPFCPNSITDGEEAGGLWLDGEDSYTIDGEFFTELAEIYGDELWDNIYNDDGSINVIDDAESFQVAARPDITEEYYYHCVDGDVTWTNAGGQIEHTVQIPVTPTLTGAATVEFAEGAHSTLGVTLNGAMLAGSADMAAILSSYTIAAFDDCGGHINPALGYHVHGTAGCSDITEAGDGDTAPFAYAIDGFLIFGPDEDATDLDACNGHESEEFGYHYHANSLEENATLTCLTGLTVEGAGAAAGGGGGGGRPERP